MSEPMTETDLAAIRASVERGLRRVMAPALSEADREHATAVLHRSLLLDEVDRLRAELGRAENGRDRADRQIRHHLDAASEAVLARRSAVGLTERYRADRDALAARLDAVEVLAQQMENEHGQSWNSISARRIREALAAPETARDTAQRAASGPDTVNPDTGRGTGVGGPHGRSEAVPQTATERLDQIRTGLTENGFVDMKGRYGWSLDNREGQRAMRSDLVWLLDHVDRLNTVLADEVPDVDGWTLYPTTDGGLMLSHDTDANGPVLMEDESLPLGAVLAFITDQQPDEPEWVAYETHCDNCKPASEGSRADEH